MGPTPLIIAEKVTASIANPITLQFATNLASTNWQTIGTFTGSINLSFTNTPAVFFRGHLQQPYRVGYADLAEEYQHHRRGLQGLLWARKRHLPLHG